MVDAQVAAGTLDVSKLGHGFFQPDKQCLGEKT
jgi:hypothetical protein